MEKSQWDLKPVRFQRRRHTQLDDFVHIYQISHNALLREFSDSTRKKKTHRVEVERWKQRRRSKKGIYVSPLLKVFPFKKATKHKVLTKKNWTTGSKTRRKCLQAKPDTQSDENKGEKAIVLTPIAELLTATPEKSLEEEHLTDVEACATSLTETTEDILIQSADTKAKKDSTQ
ncbi:hypothetical protein G5714_022091 [Onychostoma macrolepis]|uniref:Uncharacterized protein n=1 Tax=Onychostoma macrolepis TaxID=369639 RepID=A0A7J6BU99_9TELE|nr:hypothetical protein G5714_022091 [Onychostoma macrolepis]